MKVSFVGSLASFKKFNNLNIGDCFRIASDRSKGAVYSKCLVHDTQEYGMFEFATGTVWEPTHTNVELVDVEVKIGA